MQTYTIEYQAGKRYMVCHGRLILKEGLASEKEAKDIIQLLKLKERRMECVWILKTGNC